MPKVFLVTTGEYSSYSIVAAFSTREKAVAFVGDPSGTNGDYGIEERALDEEHAEIVRRCWTVTLRVADGSCEYGVWERTELATPELRAGPFDAAKWVELNKWRSKPDYDWTVQATSYVSAEHAQKLAAEHRQAVLREMAVAAPHLLKFGPPPAPEPPRCGKIITITRDDITRDGP